MSKLAIFLCVTIFASATVNAFDSSIVTTARETVDIIISSTIDSAKYQLTNISEVAHQISEQFISSASGFTLPIIEERLGKYSQLRKSIEDLVDKAAKKQINITECTKDMAMLDVITYESLTTINLCVDQKLKVILDYVMSTVTNFNKTIEHALGLQRQARACFDNVNSTESLARATSCAKKIELEVTRMLAVAFPTHAFFTTQFGFSLATFGPSLTVCEGKPPSFLFLSYLSYTKIKTTNCIEGKMNEADTVNSTTSLPTEVITEVKSEITTEEVQKISPKKSPIPSLPPN